MNRGNAHENLPYYLWLRMDWRQGDLASRCIMGIPAILKQLIEVIYVFIQSPDPPSSTLSWGSDPNSGYLGHNRSYFEILARHF